MVLGVVSPAEVVASVVAEEVVLAASEAVVSEAVVLAEAGSAKTVQSSKFQVAVCRNQIL